MSTSWPTNMDYESAYLPLSPAPVDERESLKRKLSEEAEQARALRERFLALEITLADLRTRLALKESDAGRLKKQIKEARRSRQDALQNLQAAEQGIRRLTSSVAGHKAQATRLRNALDKSAQEVLAREQQLLALKGDGDARFVLEPLICKWLLAPKPKPPFRLPRRLVLVGHGPLSHAEMTRSLAALGVDAVAPADSALDVMIVGREGWLADDLDDQIRARGEHVTRVYSQEMLLAALLAKADPLATSQALLKQFAAGHGALQYLIKSGFDWPMVTDAILKEAETTLGGVEESPLHKLGYRVGKIRGLPQRERRVVLRQAFWGELPFVKSKAYMRHWGTPGSRIRLRRMARHIFHQASIRVDASFEIATSHWSSDLNWMQDTFYEPWMRFRWPRIGTR